MPDLKKAGRYLLAVLAVAMCASAADPAPTGSTPPAAAPVPAPPQQSTGSKQADVSHADASTCAEGINCSGGNRLQYLAIAVVLYWLALVVVRWNMVAVPTRNLLLAQFDALKAQLKTLRLARPAGAEAEALNPIDELLAKGEANIASATTERVLEILFWSRGKETAGWELEHEVESQMAEFLPPEQLRAELERVEDNLRQIAEPEATAMAERISTALTAAAGTAQAAPAQDGPPLQRWGALLAGARGIYYDHLDTKFATLVSWQNKTSWLVAVALALILALAAAMQHEILFLLGAAGGLLSRLSRALNRADVPTDYGASWTTLFLSPVVGALSGWCGILLVGLAVKLNVLGPAFKDISWGDVCTPMALGFAFVLGFSERLFDEILTQLDSKALASAKPAAASTPTKAPAAATPPANAAASAGNADDDNHVDGCNVPIEHPTPDEQLPPSKGGVK